MIISERFSLRIVFIVKIACLFKLSITNWNYFDLPSQFILSSQMQVLACSSYISNQHIYPELILAIKLRWLAGGNLIDICHVYGVSFPSVYAITKTFLDAVNSCTALSIKFPTTNKEKQQTVMNGFIEKSEQQLFCGCIGAIDGYLQPISKPRKKDCDDSLKHIGLGIMCHMD